MQNMNIAGRITRDAETRTVGNDTVTSYTVAVDQIHKREKTTNWYRIDIWGKRGEALCQYLRKGDHNTVSGAFTLTEYDGKPQLNIRANEVALQGGKGERQADPEPQSPPRATADLDDEIPF